MLTLIDVSGLKAAEDALFHERYLLNSLLRTVPDAIYFKDARGRYIRFNHAMAARLGARGPRRSHRQDRIRPAGTGCRDGACTAKTKRCCAPASPSTTASSAGRRQRRRRGWDMVTRLPLLDRSNAIVGVIAIFRDVTEQVRAKAKIDEEVRRRDQFLAMLSHELRNPLGAVVTATAMLKAAESQDETHARSVEILERQSRQMARLLDDLLEASRVTQNKIELRRRVVDLRLIARRPPMRCDAQMQDTGLEFDGRSRLRAAVGARRRRPPATGPDQSAEQRRQVHATRRPRDRCAPDRDGKMRRSIRVSDNGAGISPQMLDSVFDLFVQARQTLDHADGGLGVGLTLVRALVEMHGGTVTAHSDGDGKGSEFAVRLPLTAPLRGGAGPGGVAGIRHPAGTTVVVVEDNADSLEMLCAMLKLAAPPVMAPGRPCGVGAHRRSVARRRHSRCGAPRLDGLEVARRIRANPRHAGVRLIALTGYGLASDRQATAEAGFDCPLSDKACAASGFGVKAIMQDTSNPCCASPPRTGHPGAQRRRTDHGIQIGGPAPDHSPQRPIGNQVA